MLLSVQNTLRPVPWVLPFAVTIYPVVSHKMSSAIFFFFNLFLAALGLRCCARAFSSCGEWGLLFVAVHRLLTAVASLVLHRL